MLNWLLIAFGGCFGALSRYAMNSLITYYFPNAYLPYGTLLINCLGCLIAGYGYYWLKTHSAFPAEVQLFFFVGFLGSFTTFSALALESFQFIENEQFLLMISYAALQFVIGVSAIGLGFSLGKWGH